MFYNKKIDVLGFSEGYRDDYGLWHDGIETILKSIPCDVQPITRELAFKKFGYDDNVEYLIFADYDSILDSGTMIKYNNNNYKILKIKNWDNDYLEMLVDKDGK